MSLNCQYPLSASEERTVFEATPRVRLLGDTLVFGPARYIATAESFRLQPAYYQALAAVQARSFGIRSAGGVDPPDWSF